MESLHVKILRIPDLGNSPKIWLVDVSVGDTGEEMSLTIVDWKKE